MAVDPLADVLAGVKALEKQVADLQGAAGRNLPTAVGTTLTDTDLTDSTATYQTLALTAATVELTPGRWLVEAEATAGPIGGSEHMGCYVGQNSSTQQGTSLGGWTTVAAGELGAHRSRPIVVTVDPESSLTLCPVVTRLLGSGSTRRLGAWITAVRLA